MSKKLSLIAAALLLAGAAEALACTNILVGK